MDYTTLHPMSANQAHLVDLHLWRGPPQNSDATRPIQILVNQGYIVGFCPARLQPAWTAYRVAHAEQDVDYNRPIHYHDDLRLPDDQRVGRKTFGKLGNIALNVGHMTPNEVINRQFGRLAQMETFLMSNMSPQYGSLNSGVWLKLETAIREIKDEDGKDHVWAIAGPIFGDQPASLNRGSGKYLPVPESYFCVIVDPHMYPYDKPSNAKIDCFIVPQNAPPASNPQDYPATLSEIEQAANLKFFTDWGRDVPVGMQMQSASEEEPSRLMLVLGSKKQVWDNELVASGEAVPVADSVDGLIQSLENEAASLQILKRGLSEREQGRLVTIQHTISWLLAAQKIGGDEEEAEQAQPVNLITYKIVSDMDGRLKTAARIACNFWNRFLQPSYSIVIRLGTFTQMSSTIARAYKPFEKDGVRYGVVEFNTKYLARFSAYDTAGTIVHEVGHTLGLGWDVWDTLFDDQSGQFLGKAIAQVPRLQHMAVELGGGPGTALSHWDEEAFDKELMTGYKDTAEHVLPVTIDVMELFGHQVTERLPEMRSLDALLSEVEHLVFSRQEQARTLDLEYFEETEILEVIPHVNEQAEPFV